jgi:signal-transduction protein with cAMP-binding, CBS, and nucleotidyltransferase domain
MNQQEHVLMKLLAKIRVFDHLEIHEAKKLLAFGHMMKFEKDQTIYTVGQPSDSMLILMQGC